LGYIRRRRKDETDEIFPFIETVFDPAAMETTYRELAALVEPSVRKETADYTFLSSDAAFDAAIEALIEHAYSRYTDADAFLAAQGGVVATP
jgi:hypothetical protein